MKTSRTSRGEFGTTWKTLVLMVALGLGSAPAARAADTAPAKTDEQKPAAEFQPLAPGEYNNWLTLGAGGFSTSGNQAQMQKRLGLPATAFGGIEDMHWEEKVGKCSIFTVDRPAIFDHPDYLLRLKLVQPG